MNENERKKAVKFIINRAFTERDNITLKAYVLFNQGLKLCGIKYNKKKNEFIEKT